MELYAKSGAKRHSELLEPKQPPSDANCLKYVEIANPHMWFLTACSLHEQAIFLRNSRQGTLTKVDYSVGSSTSWAQTNKSVFLLSGFALENAIKAFLVYENPQWISNGKLSSRLRSHSLLSLQKQSRQIPYKNRYIRVLQEFEAGLESWARYPCHLDIKFSVDEPDMQSWIWQGYILLMRAYGKRLMSLLGRGWNGPHEFYGKWTFEGEWLSRDAGS